MQVTPKFKNGAFFLKVNFGMSETAHSETYAYISLQSQVW